MISEASEKNQPTNSPEQDIPPWFDKSKDWQTRAYEKRTSRDQAIPEEWKLSPHVLDSLPPVLEESNVNLMDIPRRSGILTERELHITEDVDVSTLLKNLATGELTSLEVTIAFSKRAAIAQQLVS
jgi:amidase